MLKTLKDSLHDWTDIEVAAYWLSQSLGLMSPDVGSKAKHVFWSNNPVGNTLYGILHKLAEIHVLEYRDEPDHQFRWNGGFRGSWGN